MYWSEAGYRGQRNLWNYLFEPLSPVTIEDLFPGVPLDTIEGYDLQQFQELCAGTDITPNAEYPEKVIEYKSPLGVWSQRRFVHDLVNRYAVLRLPIREKLDTYERENFASHTVIGVHYRGLEKSHGQTQDGLVSGRKLSMQDLYLAEIQSRLRSFPSAKIFVATDSAQFLDNARKRFGDLVLSRPANRLSKEDELVGLHFKQQTETAKPLLAEEVLLDALLLSRTNFLVHGVSNVANAALCFDPELPHFDVEFRHGDTAFYIKKEVIRQLARIAPTSVARLQKVMVRQS